MFKIERSAYTRFKNHIMKNGELVGIIKGGLKYEFTAETVEEIEIKATSLKDTSTVTVIMYPVEVE